MSRPPLLIPIENQVRELDAKLLLAAHAVSRGHECYIGWKGSIDGRLNEFPRGIYFSKSLTSRNVKVLRISQHLGHSVVAWDEEALVHYPPDIYYARRLDQTALELTDHVYAWGQDNKELFEGHPDYPGTPMSVVGNPRTDLLRPELRPFFDEAVEEIKNEYGDFILINTNFGTINGYYPEMNVCYRKEDANGGLTLGRGSVGFPEDFAMSLFNFRVRVLDAIKALVPQIADAFPDRTIVLRPHPAENRDMWREHLKAHDNVHVVAEGNVVPWLMASDVLVHNGCTTAVESYILGRPVVAYVPFAGGEDFATEPPHKLSQVCSSVESVIDGVGDVLSGCRKNGHDADRDKILHQFVSALEGDLAVKRIIDSVEQDIEPRRVGIGQRLWGSAFALGRRTVRQLRGAGGQGRYSAGFKQQRFPDVTKDVMERKLESLGALAGSTASVAVGQIGSDLFRLSPR